MICLESDRDQPLLEGHQVTFFKSIILSFNTQKTPYIMVIHSNNFKIHFFQREGPLRTNKKQWIVLAYFPKNFEY